MRRMLTYALVCLLAASCGLWTKYDGGRGPAEGEALGGTAVSGGSVLPWREVFTDPLLQAWIDTALVHNTDLQTAVLRVQAAEASLKAGRAALLPSLQAGAEASASDGARDWGLSLGSGWEIDLFGRLANAARGAQAGLEGSREDMRDVQVAVIATVAESYQQLLMLDSRLDVSRRTLANWDRSIQVLEALKMAGKTNDIAVLQARAKRLNLEASSIKTEAQIAQAESAFCALLGISPLDVTRSSLDNSPVAVPTSDGGLSVPAGALCGRPDVRSAEQALIAAYYATNAARAGLYPSLSLSGSLGWTDGSGSVTDPQSWIWRAAASLAQPILNGRRSRSALETARAAQQSASLAFRQSVLDAGMEVNAAIVDCENAGRRIEIDSAQRDALEQAVEKIGLMMRYSTTNYLEVLTAQQSLLDAELTLIADRSALMSARISLWRALGGGPAD